MKLKGLFSTEGRYGRGEYIITDISTYIIAVILGVLVALVSGWLLIVAIPGWIALWWINIAATVKRLHDLGRPGDDILKLFIPFVGSWIDLKLMYQSGVDETTVEEMRDYQIKQNRNKYPSYKPPDSTNFYR